MTMVESSVLSLVLGVPLPPIWHSNLVMMLWSCQSSVDHSTFADMASPVPDLGLKFVGFMVHVRS